MAKKKQIILTHDELVRLAKSELAPYWVYSSPVVAATGVGATGKLFPLDPKFSEKTWMFVRVDLTEPGSSKLFEVALEWHKRYSLFPYSTLLIIHPRFEFYSKAKSIEEVLDKFNTRIPTAIDQNLAFATLTEVKTPAQINIVQGDVILHTFPVEQLNLDVMQKAEKALQIALRKNDPGLSLPFIYEPEEKGFFGTKSMSVDISETEKVKGLGLNLVGNWNVESNRITTQDSKASFSFNIPKFTEPMQISICAEPTDPKSMGSSFHVEIDEMPTPDTMLGSDCKYDEVQNANCPFKHGGTFSIAKNVNSKFNTKVTIKTPLAGNKPLAIYGFRFFS